MSRGVPSLKYLKELSGLILAHDEKFVQPLKAGNGVSTVVMDEQWKEIVELAREIYPLVAPKKKKGTDADEGSESRDI